MTKIGEAQVERTPWWTELLCKLLVCIAILLIALGYADAATLLPNGEQVFLDQNGKPLAAGTVYFYVPNTSTPKATWADPNQVTTNLNPVPLDMSGRAIIYGSGLYRQVVKDVYGNVIWDQLTGDATTNGQLSWGGRAGGTATSLTLSAANFNYTDGQSLSFIVSATNTGAVSLSVNGGPATSIYKDTGIGSAALSGRPPELIAGNTATVIYDQSANVFHLAAFPNNVYAVSKTTGATAFMDLGTLGTNYIQITGSSTINSFGSSAQLSQPVYFINFQGTDTLVYSTQMQLPTGANITTASNDNAIFQYLGGGNWQMISYSRANGTALVNPVFGASGPSTHSAGLVPDPGAVAGSHRYLNEDGQWMAPVLATGEVVPPSTVNYGYNITSIVRNSTGNYTVQFTNALADANYLVFLNTDSNPGAPILLSLFNRTSAGFTFFTVNSTTGAAADITTGVGLIVVHGL